LTAFTNCLFLCRLQWPIVTPCLTTEFTSFSVSDLLVLASIPFRISVYAGGRWLCGSIVCSISLATENVSNLASTVFVSLIVFDRYVNVCHPTDTTFARNFVFSSFATVLAWLTSICLSLPYVVVFDSFMPMRNDTGRGPHCTYHSFKNVNNLTIFITVAIRFVIPLTFILAFSILAVSKLCRLMSSRMGRQGRFCRRYIRISAVLLVGLVCHITCQSPHHILMLSGYADDKWLLALTYVSSAFNPFIYGLTNKNVRDAFGGAVQLRNS